VAFPPKLFPTALSAFLSHNHQDLSNHFLRTVWDRDVFCGLGRNSAKNFVERVDASGTLVIATADSYFLFRAGLEPDYKFEVNGRRASMNGFELTFYLHGPDLLKKLHSLWETAVLTVIGEVVDPGEIVNGLLLEDEKKKEKKGAKEYSVFKMELWFSVRDDVVCQAVCDELLKVMESYLHHVLS